MIVVHRVGGFRFVIYTSDHEPAHVHVIGDGHAKINLAGPDGLPELVFSIGIKKSDMRRLLADAMQHREILLNRWNQIHGNPE
jgi:hypothetical protein